MIPTSAENQPLNGNLEAFVQPSHTYKLNTEKQRAAGYTDGIEAVKQAVYKILLTERYGYIIYGGDYGTELADLFGQPVSYVCPELQRRITEALTWDDRIEDVTDFSFDLSKKGAVTVSFTVNSIFGSFDTQKEVKI